MAHSARTLVFVHGLWMTGFESIVLRRHLQKRLTVRTAVFSYRSVADEVSHSAGRLCKFLQSLDAAHIDLVGHSLGGLVILKCLEECAPLAPGRVVLLGSPVQGSSVARRLFRWPILRAILGRGIEQETIPLIVRRWTGAREVGVIAGNRPMGLGRLLAPMPGANDGTILVSETLIEGAADHIVLPVSHTGLIFAPSVAYQTAEFLRNGRFTRHPSPGASPTRAA